MPTNFKSKTGKTTVDVLQAKAPKVYISDQAMIKMKHYIDGCSDEIGWMGTASMNKHGYYIEDVLLFEQDVHSTTTEITPEGLGEFAEELLKQEDGVEVWNKIKMWGHSHVNMSTSSSSQDDEQMEIFSDNGHDWFIRIIANKKGEMQVDVYDFDTGIIYYNVEYFHLMSQPEIDLTNKIKALEKELEDIRDKREKMFSKGIAEEIKKKVRKITYNNKYKNQKKTFDTYSSAIGYGYDSAYDYNTGKDVDSKLASYEYIPVEDIIELLEIEDCEVIFQLESLEDVENYIITVYGDSYLTDKEVQEICDYAQTEVEKVFKEESEK